MPLSTAQTGSSPPDLGPKDRGMLLNACSGLHTELNQDMSTHLQRRSRQSQRSLEKAACSLWDREGRFWGSCNASAHLNLSIDARICLLLPTLVCSEHLEIEEGRMDMNNTAKFDYNIKEKNKKLLMLSQQFSTTIDIYQSESSALLQSQS